MKKTALAIAIGLCLQTATDAHVVARGRAAYQVALSKIEPPPLRVSQAASSVEEYAAQGDQHMQDGRYGDAALWYEKALAAEKAAPAPRQETLLILSDAIGQSYFQLQDYAKAVGFYQQALAAAEKLGQDQETFNALLNMGTCFKQQGLYAEALQSYQRALAYVTAGQATLSGEVDLGDFYYWISESYAMTGQYEPAIRFGQRALERYLSLGDPSAIAMILHWLGALHQDSLQHQQALDYYEQAIAAARKAKGQAPLETYLLRAGSVLSSLAQPARAIAYLEEALILLRAQGDMAQTVEAMIALAEAHFSLGHYDQVAALAQAAIALARKEGLPETDVALAYYNLARVSSVKGSFDDARKQAQQAIALSRQGGNPNLLGACLAMLGDIYSKSGELGLAMDTFQEAMLVLKESKGLGHMFVLRGIATLYHILGDYDRALDYYRQLADEAGKYGLMEDYLVAAIGQGDVFYRQGKPDEAIAVLEKALGQAREIGDPLTVGSILLALGGAYLAKDKVDKALSTFDEAGAIYRRVAADNALASALVNQAMIHGIYKKDYAKAIPLLQEAIITLKVSQNLFLLPEVHHKLASMHFFKALNQSEGEAVGKDLDFQAALKFYGEAIDLIENIRSKVNVRERREYLATQIRSYHMIAVALFISQDVSIERAFHSIESSRAKLLQDSLAGFQPGRLPAAREIMDSLAPESGVLIYNSVYDTFMDYILQISLDREQFFWTGSQLQELKPLLKGFSQDIAAFSSQTRGVELEEPNPVLDFKSASDAQWMAGVVGYYRHLLTHPSPANDPQARRLGHLLYQFLVKPMEARLQGKTDLLIMADGVLGMLPFETLIDDQGKYLVETYRIRYIQSFGVLDQIQQRRYPASRRQMLAFGGAVYEPQSYQKDMAKSAAQLNAIRDNLAAQPTRSGVRQAYQALGYAHWQNLPGTLAEVQGLAGIMRDSKILTGPLVAEDKLKALAAAGELGRYRILHFATHGLVVPEAPELSALVLSQTQADNSNEDGYLRVSEISQLSLQADFVNLSACETGLGKLYQGEGIVGLTQSFLIAGANGISVSLWQVDDESTAVFMADFYKAVAAAQASPDYAGLLAETKRRFIAGEFGEEYRHPFYWSPFVYYGK